MDGRSIRWTLKLLFCIGIYKKKSTWNNLLAMFRVTPTFFVTLRKSIYGIKQAPRSCYAKMNRFLLDANFSRSHFDPTVYIIKKVGNNLIILVLYFDDLILTGSDPKLLSHVNSSLPKKFEMTNRIFALFSWPPSLPNQGRNFSFPIYVCDLLHYFHMEYCKPSPSPFQFGVKFIATYTTSEVDATWYHRLVGILLYLSHTYPDISFVIGLVA
jgi:hypothetical protein